MGWAGLGWAGLGWAGLGWAGLGWAGLGWAGLGWAGLGWAGLGWAGLGRAGLGWAGLGWAGGWLPGSLPAPSECIRTADCNLYYAVPLAPCLTQCRVFMAFIKKLFWTGLVWAVRAKGASANVCEEM